MYELHIYDFDSTLFRSPQAPSSWLGDWWSDPASLLPPCVPDSPSREWWNSSVLSKAKKSVADPNVFALLMTGRKDKSAFRYRVPELLRQVGLRFDAVRLVGGQHPDGTIQGKLADMKKVLQAYPFITKVVVYDDRPSHIQSFRAVVNRLGLAFESHLVQAMSLPPLCGEEDVPMGEGYKKPKYLGIFLNSQSKAALARAFPFTHESIQNDHVTLIRNPSLEYKSVIGLPVDIVVVGHVEDHKAQAVLVDLPRGIPYQGTSHPHITISHDDTVGPVYSNTLIQNTAPTPVPRIRLQGVIDVFPRTLRSAMQSSATRLRLLR